MSEPPIRLDQAQFLLSETSHERIGPCAAEITFIGRSNVGKSTLLNALCGKAVARVSNVPGRTRAINVFAVAHERWIVDLPGYGFAQGPAREVEYWGDMIAGYLTGRPSLRMVFNLIDAKVGPTKQDLQMLAWLEAKGVPWRPVATKIDQVKSSRSAAQRRDVAHAMGLQPEQLAWVSAEKGLGVRELRGEAAALLA
ncbi:MAG TPA: ribosome biogenesis GTP-binding protein YihA/YsxC [Elusimicrobiota bacterium]|jgi:GTP-binding protein|nr:ribosome biogenesis GTP-binding protein YihA/YsxC [Elusimicrobiota bacterium]